MRHQDIDATWAVNTSKDNALAEIQADLNKVLYGIEQAAYLGRRQYRSGLYLDHPAVRTELARRGFKLRRVWGVLPLILPDWEVSW